MRFAIRRELVPGLQLKSVLHYTVLNIPKRYVLQAITLRCHVFEKTKIMASCPITSQQIDGETVETVADFILGGSKITPDGDCGYEIKTLPPWKASYDQPKQHIKKQRHYFANKGPSSQSYGFSSSHIWMCELNYKEN